MGRRGPRRDTSPRVMTSIVMDLENIDGMDEVKRYEKAGGGWYITYRIIVNAAVRSWLKQWRDARSSGAVVRGPEGQLPGEQEREQQLQWMIKKIEQREPNRYIRHFRIEEYKERFRNQKR